MTNTELIAKIKAEIERRRLHFNKEAEKYQALNNDYSQNCYGARDALRDLENFLDTLESEKPINPDDAMKALDEKIALVKQRGTWDGVDVDKYMDEVRGRDPEKPMSQRDYLDEEFAIYINRHFLNRVKYDESIDGFTTFDASDLANHFYDLGCRQTAEKYDEIEYNRQRAEESVPKDLEEAANNYLDGVYGKMPHSDYHIAIFIAGAKWQKERMMEEWLKDRDGCFWDGVER